MNPEAERLFWQMARDSTNTSLLKKVLTQDMFDKLKDKTTRYGGRLEDCIRPACEHPKSNVGTHATDPEAYDVFGKLLLKLIERYHKVDVGPGRPLKHPATDFGTDEQLQQLGDLDPQGDMIVSTRVRVARSHQGFGFQPVITETERQEMETTVVRAVNEMDGDLTGAYLPLDSMSEETQSQLVADHYLFKNDDKNLRSAKVYENWPHNRGIYMNEDKTFLVWVNEEDHLRIISMQPGGDLGQTYTRLVQGINFIEKHGVKYGHREDLGYVNYCPTNCGTGLRASVHIKLPCLAQRMDRLRSLCKDFHLEIRGSGGVYTQCTDGIFDLSNQRKFGLTEIEAVQEMKDGIQAIVQAERELQAS